MTYDNATTDAQGKIKDASLNQMKFEIIKIQQKSKNPPESEFYTATQVFSSKLIIK